jgi:hypothetical protein
MELQLHKQQFCLDVFFVLHATAQEKTVGLLLACYLLL